MNEFESCHRHCLKRVRIWSDSGPYFPAFGLNTERWLSDEEPRSSSSQYSS